MSTLTLALASVPPPLKPDLWNRWFFRCVQGVGLYLGIHESFGKGRFSVYLFSSALILGAIGLKAIIRTLGIIVQSAQSAQDAANEEED